MEISQFWRYLHDPISFWVVTESGGSSTASVLYEHWMVKMPTLLRNLRLSSLLWITHVTFGIICLFIKIWCYLEFTYWCPLLLILVKLWAFIDSCETLSNKTVIFFLWFPNPYGMLGWLLWKHTIVILAKNKSHHSNYTEINWLLSYWPPEKIV